MPAGTWKVLVTPWGTVCAYSVVPVGLPSRTSTHEAAEVVVTTSARAVGFGFDDGDAECVGVVDALGEAGGLTTVTGGVLPLSADPSPRK